MALIWSGVRPGWFVLRHAPLDLTRDANAGCCLALHCIVRAAPDRPLSVRLRTGDGETQTLLLDLAHEKSESDVTLIEIPLKAFGNGADLASVEAVEFEADVPCEITIAKLTISPMTPRTDDALRMRPSW